MTEDADAAESWMAKAAKPAIPVAELQVRGVYSLWARNISCGVWNGEIFIGIREKFGDLRLAGEYHVEANNGFHTAKPVEFLGLLPGMIEMRANDPVPGKPNTFQMYRPLFEHLLALPDNADLRAFIASLPKTEKPS